ncbi:proton pump-interactor 1 [Ricinus communis]|uniref:proton pump-interactor 1 n=1 Tax=Ricinus communis TaxID=3988 RepID=UPI000D6904E4|nr:proton pump-interactor 1 [Ricinus communis]XP_048232787.1 proton pump-interactor 1 [Ricinus communis]|eukprot:XP_015573950.2 proton pump-interactor 1 [Ricinus communis]
MEELNADSALVPLTAECKVNIQTSNVAIDRLSPDLNLDSVAEDVIDAGHDPRNVNHSDFIKFWLWEDSTSECIIQHAEKVVECMNKKRLDIVMKIEERKLDRDNIIRRLECLMYRYQSLRYNAASHKKKMEPLQLALDKLSFTNNAYHDKAIKSCLFEDEIHFNNLHFRMLHGRSSLAEEKRLLKKTRKSQQKEAIGSCSTLEELNHSISCLFYRSGCYSNDEVRRKQVLEEINQLKRTREQVIANAAVKGRIWNSLESKEIIQGKINLAGKESEEIRKKCLEVRARIKLVEKRLEAIDKDVISLQKQLIAANQRKGRAYKSILKLRKQQDEMMQSAPSNV